jgi:hypothetical protein
MQAILNAPIGAKEIEQLNGRSTPIDFGEGIC